MGRRRACILGQRVVKVMEKRRAGGAREEEDTRLSRIIYRYGENENGTKRNAAKFFDPSERSRLAC